MMSALSRHHGGYDAVPVQYRTSTRTVDPYYRCCKLGFASTVGRVSIRWDVRVLPSTRRSPLPVLMSRTVQVVVL